MYHYTLEDAWVPTEPQTRGWGITKHLCEVCVWCGVLHIVQGFQISFDTCSISVGMFFNYFMIKYESICLIRSGVLIFFERETVWDCIIVFRPWQQLNIFVQVLSLHAAFDNSVEHRDGSCSDLLQGVVDHLSESQRNDMG